MGCCVSNRGDKPVDDYDKPRPSERLSAKPQDYHKKTSADLPSFSEWKRLEELKRSEQPPQSPLIQPRSTTPTRKDEPLKTATESIKTESSSSLQIPPKVPEVPETPSVSLYKRPQGMENLGNTCYMNSLLQCLCRTPGLLEQLERNRRDMIVDRLARLIRSYHTREDITRELSDFRRVLISRLSRFKGTQQQDAKDLLLELMSYLEKINRPAAELFYGKRADKITCLKCNTEIPAEAELFVVPIERQKSQDVGSYLSQDDEFMLTGENQLKCAHCKTANDARVVTRIVQAPKILVVYIEPFDLRGRRLKQSIGVTERVTLLGRRYQLFGCVAHHGSSIHSGHFTAYVKYAKWYQCDDSSVTATTTQWSQAYLLFYESE